ncbi:cytochrome P450 86B1-like [Macadamia integrifolia]|uniref:cytochrome P450 86B1-like n=1 Tax=Macadamia integrifolia TaxID=60698 RepID=UPI001C4EEDAC|nr:cytochrome P450 86B1-like [Macadamia integrifolia]
MAGKGSNLTLSLAKALIAHMRFSDVAMALLSLFLFSALVQRLTNKGPMLWPVMGIVPTLFYHFHHLYDWATECLIKSGGTFHYRGIWMGGAHGIVTVDPTNIEYMLKTRFINFPKGQYYRERFSDLLRDGIFNADDDTWKEQRRAATSEMHSTRFVEYSLQTAQDLVHQKLLKLIDQLVASSEAVDLQEVLLRFTFDNICTVAFGIDPGCLAVHLPLVSFARAFEEATELTLLRFTVPPFVWKTMRLFRVGPERRLEKAVRTVREFAAKTVTDRRMECRFTDGSDLLSRLIKVEKFSDEFLEDFCISFILAGRDTSSVALAWFFWLIHNHPRVENRILGEIKSIVGEEERVFTMEELKKMVYLQAALSESLRLYPAVPIDFKEVREDDVFPDGTVVRKGARVLYCIFSMARMESIWGKDCKEFKPERWINGDGELVMENQFKYPVFNAGPRLCIGKKFAYMQMKMVVASVLLRYSVEVVQGQKVAPKITTTLYMRNGMWVTFKPRSRTRTRTS